MIKYLFLIVLILLLLSGVPVSYSIAVSALVGMLSTTGLQFTNIAQSTVKGISSFTLLAVPLFLLAGKLMNTGGITTKLFHFAKMLVGALPGGLGHVNIVCSVIFAGMSGSAVADAGGLGAIEMKAQRDAGYDDEFSVGITAASSALGPLIPPSIPLILYGMITGTSVGSLFIAGVLPGIFLAVCLMIMVAVMARRRHYPKEVFPGMKEALKSFVEAILPLFAVVIILAGRFSGIFTTTEAAAVVAAYALVLAMFVYKEIDLKKLHDILADTVKDTAAICLILAFSNMFGTVLVKSMIPQKIAAALTGMISNGFLMILVVVLFLLIVGMFMESTAVCTILVPILLPMVQAYGMSPIQFGILFVVAMGVGALSPPFGIIIFVMAKVAEMDTLKVIKAFVPWILLMIFITLVVAYVPALSTWLPSIAGLSMD